jgi:carboxypeptidase family protein
MVASMTGPASILVLLAAALPLLPLSAWGGEIQGRVVVVGDLPAAKKIPITIDQYVCGTEQAMGDLIISAAREIRNVVVWLENPPPGAPSAPPRPVTPMDQKECVFVPRVAIVPASGTVEFLNSDRLLHNLHSVSRENASFNRTQPKDRTIPVTFAKPEIVRIDCDLHSWMRAWVVVAPHPFYALSDAQGRFKLDNVPPGQYTVRVWHERLGETSRPVTVPATGPAPVTIELRGR